jgi:hypothetical protein
MKPKDIFNLAVRLLGLWFLYKGLAAVPPAIQYFCPAFPHFQFGTLLPSAVLIGWPLLVGWWLLRGAPWLMRLAYPEERNTRSDHLSGPQ